MIKESKSIAIISGERNITFSGLLQRIALYSRKAPMKAGERILIFSENREGWIYAFYSVWANHGIAVPVDASSTVSDVAYIINDCNPVQRLQSGVCMDIAREDGGDEGGCQGDG